MLAPLPLLESLRRQILIRRRGLAALCFGLAVWTALDVLTVAAPTGVPVLVAAHDLVAGTSLAADDLVTVRFAPHSVPVGAIRDPDAVIGRTTAVPLAHGMPVSAEQLLGDGVLAGYPDRSAIGLRIPDQDSAALLHPGDRVDLVASDPQTDADAETLVRDAVVLALPRPQSDPTDAGTTGSGRLVLFAVPRADVEHIAAVATSHYLTVIWNR